MRILVLGGTAFLSAEISRQAIAAGHRVTCLARGTSGRPPQGAAWLQADRSLGANAYDDATGEWDAVIDVARDPALARDALDALAARTGHWTLVSSCSVYADHSVPGAAEDAALLAPLPDGERPTPDNYGESKSAIEAATAAVAGGKAHTVRAGLIAGPGDGSDRYGYWPARFARDHQPVVVPAIGDAPTQVIDVRDLAAWILSAAARGVTGALNALGDQVPFAECLAVCSGAAGFRGRILAAPPEWLAAQGVSYWSGPDSLPLWLPPDHEGFMARSNQAAKAAGLVLRPLSETIDDILRDERARGLHRPRNAGLVPDTEARLARLLPLATQAGTGA